MACTRRSHGRALSPVGRACMGTLEPAGSGREHNPRSSVCCGRPCTCRPDRLDTLSQQAQRRLGSRSTSWHSPATSSTVGLRSGTAAKIGVIPSPVMGVPNSLAYLGSEAPDVSATEKLAPTGASATGTTVRDIVALADMRDQSPGQSDAARVLLLSRAEDLGVVYEAPACDPLEPTYVWSPLPVCSSLFLVGCIFVPGRARVKWQPSILRGLDTHSDNSTSAIRHPDLDTHNVDGNSHRRLNVLGELGIRIQVQVIWSKRGCQPWLEGDLTGQGEIPSSHVIFVCWTPRQVFNAGRKPLPFYSHHLGLETDERCVQVALLGIKHSACCVGSHAAPPDLHTWVRCVDPHVGPVVAVRIAVACWCESSISAHDALFVEFPHWDHCDGDCAVAMDLAQMRRSFAGTISTSPAVPSPTGIAKPYVKQSADWWVDGEVELPGRSCDGAIAEPAAVRRAKQNER
eukprot:5788500-Prymnesium_polylepis.1